MDRAIAHYTAFFANLHIDRGPRHPATSNHGAPHQPLLLLSVIDLFAKGSIHANLIEPTRGLDELFARYWSVVMPAERRRLLALPFFHLHNGGFWHLVPRPGKEGILADILAAHEQIRSLARLREIVAGARLEDDLYQLLQVHDFRRTLRTTLLESYFAPEARPALINQIDWSSEHDRPSVESCFAAPRQETTIQRLVRDTKAARQIKELYDYTCQVCGTRLRGADGPYAEGAHIRPLGAPHDGPDTMDNILCLCPNHHVLLDYGGVAVGDDLSLIGEEGYLIVHPSHSINKDHLRYRHRLHPFHS